MTSYDLGNINVLIFFLIIIFNFVFLPVSIGKTCGLFIMRLKLVYLEESNIFKRISIMLSRIVYSIFTLYMFKVFTNIKINNLAQLNFDKKFNITIVENNNKTITNNEKYYLVNFNPINYFKIFLVLVSIGVIRNIFF